MKKNIITKVKIRKVLCTALVIAMAAISLVGCATYDNFAETFFEKDKEPEATVRIGVFQPFSGEDKKNGELEKIGIELAHKIYSTAIGKQIELIYVDNKSDIYVAESAIQELVDKRVAIVLGSYGSVYSLTAVDKLESAKIPAIAITNSNPLVTSHNSYYFRVCFVDSYQGIAAAKYAAEQLGYANVAVMRPSDDDLSIAMAKAFSDKMISLTGNTSAVSVSVDYKTGDKDFTKQLAKIKASGVPMVFLPAKIHDAGEILKQAKALGIEAMFMGTDLWEDEDLVKLAGAEAAEGASFCTVFDPETGLTAITDVFLSSYRATYGEDAIPEPAVALAFDAYMIAVDAINRAGTALDGEKIKNSIAKIKRFPGSSGTITFDENGDPIKSVVIKTIHGGKPVSTFTVEPSWVVLGQ